MRIVEKVLIFVFLLGMLFKFQHYPGGSLMVVISLFALSIIYLISGFQTINLKKPDLESLDTEYLVKVKPVKKVLISNFPIALYISLSLIGFLFKEQHYPGQTVLFVLSLGLLFFAFVYTYVENREQYLSVLFDNKIRLSIVLIAMISNYWDLISYYILPGLV